MAHTRQQETYTSLPDRNNQPLNSRIYQHLLALVSIIVVIGLVYHKSLQTAMLGYDQLLHLDIVRTQGLFAGFGLGSKTLGLYTNCQCVYRPFFILQMGVLYKLFGLNHTGYQIIFLMLHMVGVGLLYLVFYRLWKQASMALILSLYLSVHPFILDHVIWVSDTNLWLNVILAIVVILLFRPRNRPAWYGIIFALLMLSAFLRENGLAIPSGVIGYAFLAGVNGLFSRRQAWLLCVIGLSAIILYFVMRAVTVGIFPENLSLVNTDLSLFSRYYTPQEVAELSSGQRQLSYLYIVLAYCTAVFFPIFNYTGGLNLRSVMFVGMLGLGGVFGLVLGAKWSTWNRTQRRWVGLLIVVISGALIVLINRYILRESFSVAHLLTLADRSRYALHIVLSIIVIRFLPDVYQRWSAWERSLAIMALILILASSTVAFVYFRYRNLNLALIGWLILFSLVFTHQSSNGADWLVRRTIPLLLISAIILNGIVAYSKLPPSGWITQNFTTSSLCHSAVSEDLALAVGREYALDLNEVKRCREEFLLSVPDF